MKLTTDIFLITYPTDYPWLPFLFRSIARNVAGFRKLIVVLEEQDDIEPVYEAMLREGLTLDNIQISTCRNYRGSSDCRGMTGQQIERFRSWSYTNADRILFVDSDCVFTRPINLENSPDVKLDKPFVVYSPWHKVVPHVVQTPQGPVECSPRKWFEPTQQVLGFVPPAECMQQFPFVYPGWFLHKLWEFVGGEERLKTFEHPNEFNCMGNYAMAEYPEHFTFIEAGGAPGKPVSPVLNMWSHVYREAGLSNPLEHPETRATLERLGLDK